MPTMTVTITDVPSFAAVKEGYGFTGKMSLPQVVDGAIRINSMKLYYGYVRRYVRYVFLRAVCGDTTFNTEYFSLQPDETLKEITKVCTDIVEGTDHLLRQNGRTISFTVACDYSTSSNVVARPRGGNMTLTVDYTILQSGLTLDKDSVDAGQPIRATITAGDAAYTHKLTFTAGSRTETIELLAGVGSADYTIPLEWLEEIPRTTELQATATLDTYSGDTLMGSEEKTFTITCPANVLPTCQVTAEPVNGFEGMYLSGRSSVKLAIVNAQGVYGSEVVGYQLTGAGYDQYLTEATYGPLVQGERTFTASVTDTRGRVGKAQVTVTVLPYTAPSLTNVRIYRSNGGGIADDAGAYIAVQATALFASANDINTVTLQARYRTAGGAWGAWTDIVSGEQALLGGGALLATISYEAQVQVTDLVGNSASFMQRIPTSQVAFNLKEGGSAAAFGRYAERDKALSLPEDWRYYRGETDIEQKADEALAKAEEALENAGSGSGGDADTLGGKVPVYYLTPVNVLDNGDFTNPINQRGETSYTAEGYTIDRWRLWGSDNAVTVNDGYVSVTGVMQQYLETYDPEMTYTLAACNTAGEVLCVSGVFGDEAAKADWGELAYSTNYSLANVALRTGDWVWAAVYEGEFTAETLPPYVPKGYTAELHRCQRYAYAPPNKASMIYPGYTYSATVGYFTIKTPAPMRELPTLTVETVGNVQVLYGTNTKTCTNAYAYAFDKDAVSIRVASSGMPWPACINCRFNTPAFLDCELA